MRRLLLTTAFLGASATGVLAGSPEPVPNPAPVAAPPPVAQPIGGEWTGFFVGAQLGFGSASTSGAADLDGDGILGGVNAGYTYDFGRYVLGGEIDYDFADIDLDGAAEINSVFRLKARGGVDLGPSVFYGTAGYAYADTSVGNEDGYFVGIGLEYAINPSVSVGGEVLYHEFDDIDGSGIDADATTASARVTFRF